MAEPPAKRQRRTDDSGHRDDDRRNATSRTTGRDAERHGDRYSRDRPLQASGRNDQRRQRSRSREPTEQRRDRSRDRDRDRDRDRGGDRGQARGGHTRSGRDERDRNWRDDKSVGPTKREETRADRPRTRSRSPVRERDGAARPTTRQRSPPHASRSARSPERPPRPKDTSDRRPVVRPATNEVPKKDEALSVDSVKMDMETPLDSEDELQLQMQKVMGFGKFRSTKNTKVPGNDKLYAVRKEKKTEYRQYMNRVGGFNRPLSPSHE